MYLVFLLITPQERPELHVQLLGLIASAVSQADVRGRLRDAAEESEIRRILTELAAEHASTKEAN